VAETPATTGNDDRESGVRSFQSFDRARLGKFLFPLFEPGRGGLTAIERPSFSMNDIASTPDKELA
jgi:hypothetical protein